MIQRIVPNSPVAAAYILIISRSRRDSEALVADVNLSAISHEHSNSTEMLVISEVTYDIMDSL